MCGSWAARRRRLKTQAFLDNLPDILDVIGRLSILKQGIARNVGVTTMQKESMTPDLLRLLEGRG